MHPLVDELVALVPPPGAPWPRAARERWVAALGAVLEVLYEDGPLRPPTEDTSAADHEPGEDLPAVDDPVHDEGVAAPSWSTSVGWSVLDLRSEVPEARSRPGKHARRTAYD